MSQFPDELHSACLIINARVNELHKADKELNTTVGSIEKRTPNITSKEHEKQPKSNNDKDDKKTESSITPNNNTNIQNLCTGSNVSYIQKFGHQYPDVQTEMEQDETEPIIGDPNLMLFSSNVVPSSRSDDGNDRKNSISEDFRRINSEQNNQEHQNDELEASETWDESYLNNEDDLTDLTTNPAQKRRSRATKSEVQRRTENIQKRRQRSTKAELMKMTENEKLEKKREGARNNTKNFYDRKKNGIKQMKENLEKTEKEFGRMVNQKKDCEKNIATALEMIWEYMRYTLQDLRNRFEIKKQEYKNAIKHIDDRFEIRELKEQVEEARRKFNKAEADIALKLRNPNTFGSKKCRAKNEKEKAEANLGLKTKKLEQNELTKHLNELQFIQSKIREHFIHVRDQIGLQGMISMAPNKIIVFENLLTFFKLGNPVN